MIIAQVEVYLHPNWTVRKRIHTCRNIFLSLTFSRTRSAIQGRTPDIGSKFSWWHSIYPAWLTECHSGEKPPDNYQGPNARHWVKIQLTTLDLPGLAHRMPFWRETPRSRAERLKIVKIQLMTLDLPGLAHRMPFWRETPRYLTGFLKRWLKK